MTAPTIIEFITDRQLLNLTLSAAQEVIVRAIYALPATPEQRELFTELTGRTDWPTTKAGEVSVIGGARGGKDSRLLSPIVTYEALFGGHERYLARGERGVMPIVYQDARASKVGGQYIESYLRGSSLLKSMVEDITATEIRLANRTSVMRFPCTAAAFRSWSIPVGGMNELGSYPIEGQADADVEIQAAIRRGMVGFPHSLLLKVSTPWLKAGVLWDDYQRFGEPDPDRLVFKAPSWVLNPTLVGRLERERRVDARRFDREYGAEFGDVLARPLLDAAAIAAAMPTGVRGRSPQEGQRVVGHLDMSTGLGSDALGFALAGQDGEKATLVYLLHVPPPFNPREAVQQVAQACRRYGVSQITIDKFSPGLVIDLLRHVGIEGKLAESDTSAAFISLLMLMNTGGVSLLDSDVLRRELAGLQRKPSTGGRDVVGHGGGGGHDDLAAACAFAITAAARAADELPLLLIGSARWYQWMADHAPVEPADDTPAAMPDPEASEPGVLARITTAATAAKDAIVGAITGAKARLEIASLPQLRDADDHWVDPASGISPWGAAHLDAKTARAAGLVPRSQWTSTAVRPKPRVPRSEIEAAILREGMWMPGGGLFDGGRPEPPSRFGTVPRRGGSRFP